MSLLESMMEKCRIVSRVPVDDPYGSFIDYWGECIEFDATIIKDRTTEEKIAERRGIKESFTVVTRKGFTLRYHDVFIRLSDNQAFRVTSDTKDSEAPEASTVKIVKVTAEKCKVEKRVMPIA